MNRKAVFGVALLCIVGCASPATIVVDPRIVEPQQGQGFPFGTRVNFRTEGPRQPSLIWRLANGDLIGRGVRAEATFTPGEYQVQLVQSQAIIGSVSFHVLPPEYVEGNHVKYVQTASRQAVPLSPGRYKPVVVNTSASDLTVELLTDPLPATPNLVPPTRRNAGRLLDWYPPRPSVSGSLEEDSDRGPTQRLDTNATVDMSEESRAFTVPDPADGGATVHNIAAIRLLDDPDFVIWADSTAELSAADINYLSMATLKILPRCRGLFGAWGDTNNDSRIHILLTPVLNQGAVAVGFFNPSDVFSSSYAAQRGLVSNGLNLITLGVPDFDSPQGSFTLDSLCATIAHELFHLILFERKSRPAYLAGSLTPPLEETFLDEGLAHLSETLNGYGISGGNIFFAQRYLAEPHRYSLGGRSTTGEFDSVGRRGAMLLLLSYLFWHLGGMEFDSNGEVIDRGGVRFLKAIVASQDSGWSALCGAMGGVAKASLFSEWVTHEIETINQNEFLVVDPDTQQPLRIGLSKSPYKLGDGTDLVLDAFGTVGNATSAVAADAVAVFSTTGIQSWPQLTVHTESDLYASSPPPGIVSIWYMQN